MCEAVANIDRSRPQQLHHSHPDWLRKRQQRLRNLLQPSSWQSDHHLRRSYPRILGYRRDSRHHWSKAHPTRWLRHPYWHILCNRLCISLALWKGSLSFIRPRAILLQLRAQRNNIHRTRRMLSNTVSEFSTRHFSSIRQDWIDHRAGPHWPSSNTWRKARELGLALVEPCHADLCSVHVCGYLYEFADSGDEEKNIGTAGG